MNRHIPSGPMCLAALITLVAAAPAGAQVEELGVGAGVSVPIYEAAERHGAGPGALVFVGYRLGATLQLRGTASLTRTGGKPRDSSPQQPVSGDWGDMRVAGVSGALVWTPDGNGNGPYGFAGLGLYSLRDSETGADPEGITPGLTLGVGTNVRVGRISIFGQTGMEVPFTSFGTDSEFAPFQTVPVTVGVRVPCCGSRASGR